MGLAFFWSWTYFTNSTGKVTVMGQHQQQQWKGVLGERERENDLSCPDIFVFLFFSLVVWHIFLIIPDLTQSAVCAQWCLTMLSVCCLNGLFSHLSRRRGRLCEMFQNVFLSFCFWYFIPLSISQMEIF